MSVAFRSAAIWSTTGLSVSSQAATHPAGLTAGDLMVAEVFMNNSFADIQATGWTEFGTTTTGQHFFWKKATSGDVAAGSSTWFVVGGGVEDFMDIAIGAWSGTFTATTPVELLSQTDASTSTVTTPAIIPTRTGK